MDIEPLSEHESEHLLRTNGQTLGPETVASAKRVLALIAKLPHRDQPEYAEQKQRMQHIVDMSNIVVQGRAVNRRARRARGTLVRRSRMKAAKSHR